MRVDVLVVGAGFSGAVVAERLASHRLKVLVIDKRAHIGGNAYDRLDAHGVLIHPYGPHIFHTNAARIAEYLSQFTDWRFYEHRVLAKVADRLVPMPINIDTVNAVYGLSLTEATIQAFFDTVREPRSPLKTSEDVALNAVGVDLYEKFIRGYTRKQWGLDPSELSASVVARIPTRTNHDDRYFTDTFQHMPLDGYTRMFQRMLDNRNIDVEVNVDFFRVRSRIRARHVVYTGPIDAYFDYCHGRLPYRSIEFEHAHLARMKSYQPVGTVNFPNDHAYTRITEFRHLTGQAHSGTSIVKEYPRDDGDPYYPVPRPENERLFKRYEALAKQASNVTFVGRLAQYRYYNMDQCVGAALKAAEGILERIGIGPIRSAHGATPRVRGPAPLTAHAQSPTPPAALA
ncbi:MAG: UDP-galactopyranose mutase [Rhodospirillaceae bacterium]